MIGAGDAVTFRLTLYFVRGRDERAVIDTGITTTPAEYIGPFLTAQGGIERLAVALCTHGHIDHVGGNGALKAS